MFSLRQTPFAARVLGLLATTACSGGLDAEESQNPIIDPPAQCSGDRPDCSLSEDFPDASDLTPENSAGIRYSNESGALVIDRVSTLPDIDGDGVPDDADDCPGTPDWITCDDDPTNDGVYATVFYDPSGASEVARNAIASTVADIPKIDVYFLIDATPTLTSEIGRLQAEILTIVDDVRALYGDARFGVGIYREYPLPPLADAHSQSPYHHVLDLTDDDALVQTAFSSLNTVANDSLDTAATQALYSVASGMGLGDMVPNRGACPNPDDVGYPCFRDGALHVVMNITDDAVFNGPNPFGAEYTAPPFEPGVGDGVTTLPPVQMFPSLFAADSAATALDLGDLSGQSLTLMGMSTLLTNQVNTAVAPGCATTPPDPPGADMDDKDVVLALRFDAPVLGTSVFANNTHWPGANVALFDDMVPLLDPLAALACDGGTVGDGRWGRIDFAPTTAQQYYLVIDGIVPAADPGHMPEGAFSVSIVHDGDPADVSWLTTDAPVAWTDVEAALLSSAIHVASVVTLRGTMSPPSEGNLDARLIAQATGAVSANGDEWVNELPSNIGEGLAAAVSNTLRRPKTDSTWNISMRDLDNPSTGIDERDFIRSIWWDDCSQGEPLGCAWGAGLSCRHCEVGAAADFEIVFLNDSVPPTASSQVFDFELIVHADDVVEVERIPVRVMVPDSLAHEFDATPASAFYRNAYDSTARCNTPPERPKWGDLTWQGSTPSGTSIDFQIRTSPTMAELATATPVIISIPGDTTSRVLNLTDELIAGGQPWGLPYLQITALLNPSTSPPATPLLEGWRFEFVCEAAE